MKYLIKLIAITAVMAMTAVGFTSCDDDPGPMPPPGPPGGYGDYYDPALFGDWELVTIDGYAIRPFERNYLSFFPDGRGEYFYLVNGYPYGEPINYRCDLDGYGDPLVTIRYADGQISTMYYWFEGNSLLLQWDSGGRLVTYRYLPVSYIPW